MKAGSVISGEAACLEAIKKKKAFLCIIAADASHNTKKRLKDKCDFRDIEYFEYGNKESIGGRLGKNKISVVCIKNESFTVQLKRLREQNNCSVQNLGV
jgi:ribosomal protein L7Ae-like RNA K-turn-binding protein